MFQKLTMVPLQLHHYTNTSVSTSSSELPAYDGHDYFIPRHTVVILVPCNDPHCRKPSAQNCLLINRHGVQRADDTQLLVMYMIDNTSDEDLWLKHGDLLGVGLAPYTDMDRVIYAERSLMMISYYEELITESYLDWFMLDESDVPPPCCRLPRPDSPRIDFAMSMRSPRPPPLDIINEVENLTLCD